ncbi:MAG TPA: hypothetical protein VNG12_23495 [Acidimicrobiales bacterium]|nr:hypothetical protein [Acidimicrobiales bacterium]
MSDDREIETGPRKRSQLVKGLDRMVASGRVTESEAEQLRATEDSGEFETAIRDIRVRHAGAKLTAAVEGGHMTQEEADANLERLRSGDHMQSLRAYLRRILPGDRK